MRITQGQFSFLPELTDPEIKKQIEYALGQGWALSIEYTDDPHPRNTYWSMWGIPMFDLKDPAGVMMEVNACRKAQGHRYIRLLAFDSQKGFETIRMSFIINRPAHEPGFELIRTEADGRRVSYTLRSYSMAREQREPPVMTTEHAPVGDEDTVDLEDLYVKSSIASTMDELDRDLVGLRPVKTRIREIAALLLVERARRLLGMQAEPPSLHMSFTGNPGTGKTTVAQRIAQILHGLEYIRRNHVVSVTRDDLVGQYIGHTAPKTKEILKKAMGGVLFIDEAYYLYRPENERDYGQEAIEILLQVMEEHRDDLVVVLAGYKDRMDTFFKSNPGMASRIAHHIDFPDYSASELSEIAELMVAQMHYRFDDEAKLALRDYIDRRMTQPRFSNARSIRNALDRARLRQANRLFASRERPLSRTALATITSEDIRASRVFAS